MLSFLAKTTILIFISVAFALARKYLPPSTSESTLSASSWDELNARFKMTQWIVAAGLLVTGSLLFFSLRWMLVAGNRYFASFDDPAVFVLLPQSAIWFILPGFVALACSWELTLWGWTRLDSKQTALLYKHWSDGKAGFNSTRLLRIMALVICLPLGIFTVLVLPEHDSLRSHEICSRQIGQRRVFQYRDATALVVIDGFRSRDGRLVQRAGCILYFRDGRRWSSAERGDFRSRVDPTLVTFLESKTGLRASYRVTESEGFGPKSD